MKDKIIKWLKNKNVSDIKYVKGNPDMIFISHPEISRYDIEQLVNEPERIINVEKSLSHEDRIVILYQFSKRYSRQYIILDPFYTGINSKFRNRVAIVTAFPVKNKKRK